MTNNEYTTLMAALSLMRRAMIDMWDIPESAGITEGSEKRPVVQARKQLGEAIAKVRDLLEDTENYYGR